MKTRSRDCPKAKCLGKNLLIGDDDAVVPRGAERRSSTLLAKNRSSQVRERNKCVVVAPFLAKANVDARRKRIA